MTARPTPTVTADGHDGGDRPRVDGGDPYTDDTARHDPGDRPAQRRPPDRLLERPHEQQRPRVIARPLGVGHGVRLSGIGIAGRAATVDRLGGVLTVVLTRHGLTDRSDPEQHLGPAHRRLAQRRRPSPGGVAREAPRRRAVRPRHLEPPVPCPGDGRDRRPRRPRRDRPAAQGDGLRLLGGPQLRADRGGRRRLPARVGARPGPARLPGRRDGQRGRRARARRSSTT